jgi:hypothetical protein
MLLLVPPAALLALCSIGFESGCCPLSVPAVLVVEGATRLLAVGTPDEEEENDDGLPPRPCTMGSYTSSLSILPALRFHLCVQKSRSEVLSHG